MLNIGGGEVIVILIVALMVLGPTRLPDAIRQVGRVLGEVRRVSAGFQSELQAAMDDPIESAARERGTAADERITAPSDDAGSDDSDDDNHDDSDDSDDSDDDNHDDTVEG